jgi:hypothetical protein
LAQDRLAETLQRTHYTWDMLSDYTGLHSLSPHLSVAPVHQQFTPRYGYDVPTIIEEAGLTEQFEACFDASVALYSALQQGGADREAQYAVLSGHRLRWKANTTALDMLTLGNAPLKNAAEHLWATMHTKLSETHPVINELLLSKPVPVNAAKA